jgi:uncharacterized protein YciI
MVETSQYLYKIQAVRPEMVSDGPTPEEAATIERHSDYLRRLAERGVIVLGGRTLNADASTFGIVIFEADSEDAALAIMNDDPAVSEGVMRAELYPYRIAFMRGA